ncbi:MAG: hypothetical protein MI975_11980 [Cytophagales bacterium]|nr:hypothetical protein [Cytophagales bacterium]
MKQMEKMNQNNTLMVAAVLIILGILLGSCGENADPHMAEIKMEMKAVSRTNALNSGSRITTTEISYTEVLIGVTEIELERLDDVSSTDDSGEDADDDSEGSDDDDDNGDHKSDDDEIEFEGQFVVDLINGSSTPDFGIADVVPGVYEEIEIEISPIMDDGNSIFVAFTYQPEGSDPVAVEFASQETYDIEIENDKGIKLDGNTSQRLLILLDLDQLMSGIDLSMADLDEDDVIRINGSSNSEIEAKITNHIDEAFEAGEDNDEDDEIDDHD